MGQFHPKAVFLAWFGLVYKSGLSGFEVTHNNQNVTQIYYFIYYYYFI